MSVVHGFAHIDGKYPSTSSFLITGFNAGKTIGFSASKLQLAPNYATVYPTQSWGSTPTTLAELAATTPFQIVFNDSQVKRYYFNTWTFANGTNHPWIVDISRTQLENEYAEIYNLGVYLLGNYSNKTFIINQWEGDWALLGNFIDSTNVPPYRAERMAANLAVRQKAVNDARKNVRSTSVLLHSVEVNRCLDPSRNTSSQRCIPNSKTRYCKFFFI